MANADWKQATLDEIKVAETARRNGNEGRARVCARRAAGIVAGEFLARQGNTINTESAIQKLRYLESYPGLSPTIIDTIQHFLIHTTPEHKLPIDADLITDVHLLVHQLLDDSLD